MYPGDVWAESGDGEILRSLFGHYPTLREAVVRECVFDKGAGELRMVLLYQDMPEDQSGSLRVLVELVWCAVDEVRLNVSGNELNSISFRRDASDLLVTDLSPGWGMHGTVKSRDFRVSLQKVEPEEALDPEQWRLEIR